MGQGWKTAHSAMLDVPLVCREEEGTPAHAFTVLPYTLHILLMIIKPLREVCQGQGPDTHLEFRSASQNSLWEIEKMATMLSSFSHEEEASVPHLLAGNGLEPYSGRQDMADVASCESRHPSAWQLLLLWFRQHGNTCEQVQERVLGEEGRWCSHTQCPGDSQPTPRNKATLLANSWPQAHE